MSENTFRALVLDDGDGAPAASTKILELDALPDGDVTVAVAYSDLNYKDGMVLKGIGGLVKSYPHVPGIDFSGTVESSRSPRFKEGDPVILTGWRVGEVRWGGYASRARVPSDWLVPLPQGMTLLQSMALGTAGFTAMLAVMALEELGLSPTGEGEVLVSGAAGGVGSVAVALLAALGYRVAASTGRAEAHAYLRELGATTIVDRAELEAPPTRPLASERWAGAIDNVGGTTLANVLAQLHYRASCASVGLAGGANFEASVIPFVIRGVKLLGIDSATSPSEQRMAAWNRLAREMPGKALERMTTVVALEEVPDLAGDILSGRVRGRTVVDVNA
ncbi:MAG: MDR family oxidoreductase [Rhodospirillales bacterium]|jgi:acrylyl-CoA reductase (NADPH)|nr:MDR family oxidoreductase [Rhodospirillales bacterium]